MPTLGKCPKCDAELTDDDVKDVQFRGVLRSHFAYKCNKCGYIIGFSSFFRS